jgi:hypothetical protein
MQRKPPRGVSIEGLFQNFVLEQPLFMTGGGFTAVSTAERAESFGKLLKKRAAFSNTEAQGIAAEFRRNWSGKPGFRRRRKCAQGGG